MSIQKTNNKSLKSQKVKSKKVKAPESPAVDVLESPAVDVSESPAVDVSETPVVNTLDVNVFDSLKYLVNESKKHISTLKDMSRLLNTLEKVYERDLKIITKKSKKNKRRINNINRQPSGFAKPIQISDKLCKFYGVNSGTLVSRTDITRAITKHIRENELQVTDNRRQFTPDKKLKSILSPLDSKKKDKNGLTDKQKGYTYFNVQKYISTEFIKS